MRSIVLGILFFGFASSAQAELNLEKLLHNPSPKIQVAMMCFKSYEYTSGMNKICVYDCLGGQAAITISAVALCPLSINR